MEGAGKLIDDEDLREAMREKGLGTPATRAQIIEGLLAEKYIYREGKELVPTAKAFSLLTLLHGLGVPELFSPELTAEWEFKLAQMEHGQLARDAFMREIVAMTQHIVGQAKGYESDTIPGDFATLGVACPKCGGEVHENYKKFQCQACDFGFWKIMAGRQFETAEAEALLRERAVGPLDGFRSKLGRPFSASIKLNDELAVKFDFEDGPGPATMPRRPISAPRKPLGDCPKCGARVFEHGQSYVCEKATGPAKSCDFRSGRLILQRPIEPAQMKKLLATGKTDLLQFVSARTRRPFSAFLVRQPDGKIGFEFEAKVGGKGARGARGGAPLRVLGPHPDDQAPVELHAGRYGPYVKHGSVNATLPDRDKVDSLTLDEALAILAEKIERGGGTAPAKRGGEGEDREGDRGGEAAGQARDDGRRARGTEGGEAGRAQDGRGRREKGRGEAPRRAEGAGQDRRQDGDREGGPAQPDRAQEVGAAGATPPAAAARPPRRRRRRGRGRARRRRKPPSADAPARRPATTGRPGRSPRSARRLRCRRRT